VIVDTSAVVAILFAEPDAGRYAAAIEEAEETSISAANYLEAGIIVDGRRRPVSRRRLDDFFGEAGVVIVPVDEHQARIAREAYRDFGKGSGHPARLNFGDCFAYALARSRREPLLFKGDDFIHTDITPAIA
jgi:ribonuclease VapC